MPGTLIWLSGLAHGRRGLLAGAAAGVAVAVALLAGIGAFLGASKATMTTRAARTVAVDWQLETTPGADPAAVIDQVRHTAHVTTALPVGFLPTNSFSATTGTTTQTTAAGVVVGLPDGYQTAFPDVTRTLIGNPTGVLLAQQTAANLNASPGDHITIALPGRDPTTVGIDGIVDLPQADSFFQPVGAPTGTVTAPPDNVLLVPATVFDQLAAGVPAGGARPRTQIHVRLDHQLPADPVAAYSTVTGMARNLEATLAGTGQIGDNLGATLAAARTDALYAQILFLFLGAPGALLAAFLTAAVADSARPRRQRDQALLRTRGATSRQLTILGLGEAAAIGVTGAAVGLAAAAGLGQLLFGHATYGATPATTLRWATAAALTGIAIAVAAVAVPAWRDARTTTITTSRRTVPPDRRPLWSRLGVDLWCLAGAAAINWLAGGNGYQLVLAPEGTPTISVSYWAFAGPALLWIGAALLTWRLVDLTLRRGPRVTRRLLRPITGGLADTIAAALQRQRRLVARSAVLVALAVSFAVSTATFNATYQQQAHTDAVLTNGADVNVTEPATTNRLRPEALAAVPGVAHVEPVQHRFAYVGTDLQDLYGVNPDTIIHGTTLADSYFTGGTANQLMARLAHQPDGILVAAETVKDFQLQPGDLIRLRLQQTRTSQYREVPFHYIGTVKEFPTAPRDSFLVANAGYIATQTGNDHAATYLLTTNGAPPATVAQHARDLVGTHATVTEIGATKRRIGSSLTAVDLAGLTRLELGFAIILASAAGGLVLALGLAERRRTYALAAAVGARPRQLAGFVWSEAVVVAAAGLAAGALTGWALSALLVTVLTGVFDPAPDTLTIPWTYLAVLTGAAATAIAISAHTTLRATARPAPEILRTP